MLDNAKCTIFNRYDLDDGSIVYYPTTIEKCHVIADKKAAQTKSGLEDADALSLSIDYDIETDGSIIVGKKIYLSPQKWRSVINDDLPKYVTFREGNDLVLIGDWEGEKIINASDPIYGIRGFYSWLRNNYDDVFLISSVGKYDLIPHFEIGGR